MWGRSREIVQMVMHLWRRGCIANPYIIDKITVLSMMRRGNYRLKDLLVWTSNLDLGMKVIRRIVVTYSGLDGLCRICRILRLFHPHPRIVHPGSMNSGLRGIFQ